MLPDVAKRIKARLQGYIRLVNTGLLSKCCGTYPSTSMDIPKGLGYTVTSSPEFGLEEHTTDVETYQVSSISIPIDSVFLNLKFTRATDGTVYRETHYSDCPPTPDFAKITNLLSVYTHGVYYSRECSSYWNGYIYAEYRLDVDYTLLEYSDTVLDMLKGSYAVFIFQHKHKEYTNGNLWTKELIAKANAELLYSNTFTNRGHGPADNYLEFQLYKF